MTNKTPENMLQYYAAAAPAYSNWGADLNYPSIYALHSGFSPSEESLGHYQEIAEYNRRLISFADITDGQRVLDAGCGTGSISFTVASLFPNVRVLGINLSEIQLQTAQELKISGQFPNTDFSLQNYSQTGLKDKIFDKVLFCESFCHALDKTQTLAEVHRLLNSGGRIIVADCFLTNDPLSSDQESQIKQYETGFCLAPIISVNNMFSQLSAAGFIDTQYIDITENILPSARAIAQHAQIRLNEGRPTSEVLTASRYACVAAGQMLENGGLKYFYIKSKLD